MSLLLLFQLLIHRFALYILSFFYNKDEFTIFILVGLFSFLIFAILLLLYFSKSKAKALNELNFNLENKVKEQTKLISAEYELTNFYLNNVNSLIVALDINGNITMINSTGCNIFAY